MSKSVGLTLRQRLLGGFLCCVLITAAASLLGVWSLRQTKLSSEETSRQIGVLVAERHTVNKGLRSLREAVHTVRNADREFASVEKKVQAQLAPLKENRMVALRAMILKEFMPARRDISAAEATENAAIDTMKRARSRKAGVDQGIKDSRAQVQKQVDVLVKQIMELVDTIEFNLAIKLEDSISNAKKQLAAETKKTGDATKQLDAIESVTESSVTVLKSALCVRSGCGDLKALVNALILADNADLVAYSLLPLKTQVTAMTADLSSLPPSEGKTEALKSLGSVLPKLDKLAVMKKESLLAEQAMTTAQAQLTSARAEKTRLQNDMAAITSKLETGLAKIEDEAQEASQIFRTKVERSTADNGRAVNKWIAILTALGVFAVVLAIVIGLLVAARVMGPINSAKQLAITISKGDLSGASGAMAELAKDGRTTQDLADEQGGDEAEQLLLAIRIMTENLSSLIGKVKRASIQLNSTATELAATGHQQEATARSFGASTNEMAAALKENTATGAELVQTMDEVSEVATGTATLATEGHASLQEIETNMRGLDQATGSIAEKLAVINERASNITGIVTTITKVADQTNLLSVNAAIEAEKAGEYGVGFLVVAREIRRLADQTASSTLDIEQMVQQMQSAVSTGVMEMDRFTDQVRRAVDDVGTISLQMGQIIERVDANSASFKLVNESMVSQSQGAEQISDAMEQLTLGVAQTREALKENAQAADDLHAAIGELKTAIASFRLKD